MKGPTAVSPMSILAHQARKSGEHLEGRKRRAVDANRDPMRGRIICEDRLIPSTTVIPFPWRRASNFQFRPCFGKSYSIAYFYHLEQKDYGRKEIPHGYVNR